jgi:hypothetical protein
VCRGWVSSFGVVFHFPFNFPLLYCAVKINGKKIKNNQKFNGKGKGKK